MKTIGIILVLVVAVLGLIASIGYSTIERTQRQYGQNQHPTAANENNYPPFETALRVGFEKIGAFVHDYREEIVAIGTLCIAAFTVVLAFATGFLYSATRDLVKGAEKVSQTQLRAFVIAKGFSQAANLHPDNNGQLCVREWVFWFDIENVGLTPGTGLKAWIKHQVLSVSKDQEPHFEWIGEANTGVIGPRGTGKSSYYPIPLATMIDLWERRVEVYLGARVEYRDVFNPSVVHHHEQCVMLDLVRHPADVERGPDAEKNLPRVVMRIYGPQNTVG